MRSITSYNKVQRAIGAARRGRRQFLPVIADRSYVDIGCGPNMHPGFVSVDYTWRPGLDICWDITRGLPFSDNSIACIFSEHCIEHISLKQGLAVFVEMHRILMPGRLARIIAPDLEIYLSCYREQRPMPYPEDDHIIGPIMSPAVSINRIMRAHGHQFIYDFNTMKIALENAGFIDVQKQALNKGNDPKLLIDTPERAVESLYVEARKPLIKSPPAAR